MNTNLSAAELRRWAAQCVTRMKDPLITGAEYDRLIKMRDGLLAVAESQAWLEGEELRKAPPAEAASAAPVSPA